MKKTTISRINEVPQIENILLLKTGSRNNSVNLFPKIVQAIIAGIQILKVVKIIIIIPSNPPPIGSIN